MFFLLGILVGCLIGYLLSFLDLQWFFNEILTVSKIQNKFTVIAAFVLIAALFVIIIIIPMKKVLENQEVVPTVNTTKNVSVRLELKRRGSWPVAYSNKYAYNYNKAN